MNTADSLPVIWTVSVSRLAGLLADVALEYADRARFHAIDLAFEQAHQVIDQRLHREHCDVVVAGGANAAFLRGRLQVPLVTVQASGFDLIGALTRARRIHPAVGLVTHAGDLPDIAPFAQAFGLELAHRSFDTREEARDCVADLKARGVGVIVGTGMAIDFAEANALPGVLLYSADAVRRSFDQALQLARANLPAPPSARPGRSGRKPARQLLLGDSAAMAALRSQIALYAPQPSPVVICGEAGSGKGLVARQLHAASARNGRLQVLGCSGLDASSLESELAYSSSGQRSSLLEAASAGSLLLDNIDELPLPLQGRLLRLVDATAHARGTTAGHDVRLLATCRSPLDAQVAAGRFRADLYHRLAGLSLKLPALRERDGDAALLLDHYLAVGGPVVPLSAGARDFLLACPWPGNVRELRMMAERIALHWRHRPQGAVEVSHLQQWLPELFEQPLPAMATPASGRVSGRRPDAESLRQQLHRFGGDRQRLMAHYQVSRTTLWRWLRQAGVN